ncbi:hypothetical protein DASC09_030180 [Saccharomycopsis crataegensis]|uniref:Uncharacterized protein n=1 Tax=Saccharomycopsis crataegensis TaxID=43959 RepID=A0AAV5QLM9_9ASCO|nr:hypothetical protein DASC09_030180 [Saccharomycopsis crataegensis]
MNDASSEIVHGELVIFKVFFDGLVTDRKILTLLPVHMTDEQDRSKEPQANEQGDGDGDGNYQDRTATYVSHLLIFSNLL